MRTIRTKVGIRYAGDPLLTARCKICGHRFAAITADRDATVEHSCPTPDHGPMWTLTASSNGIQLARARTWAEHLEQLKQTA